MTDMLRLTFTACLGLASIVGCHRGYRGYEWMSTAGYRYRAGAAIVGPARDTLRVAVVVVNESNQQRELPLSRCPPYSNPLIARVSAGGRNWSSEIYEERQHGLFRDSTGHAPSPICDASLSVMRFPPGASHTSLLKVPLRGILGDSLPSGRYRVSVRLEGSGGDGRKLDAGEVEL